MLGPNTLRLQIEQVAELLKLSVEEVEQLIKKRRIAAHKNRLGSWEISGRAFREYEKKVK